MDRYETTIEAFDKQAEAYFEKFVAFELYNKSYDNFCSFLEKNNPDILEVGCGPGNVTKYLLSSRPDFNIEGIDLAPSMVKLAIYNNPNARFRIMDARSIHQIEKKYDAVMCGFCMPYLSKEECIQLIFNSGKLLRPGGIFYFSTMEGNYTDSGYQISSNGKYKTYRYLHEETYLTDAVSESDMEIVSLERQIYTKHDGSSDMDMFFIVRKKEI
jgi:predicted TPR repeat methyltransferase